MDDVEGYTARMTSPHADDSLQEPSCTDVSHSTSTSTCDGDDSVASRAFSPIPGVRSAISALLNTSSPERASASDASDSVGHATASASDDDDDLADIMKLKVFYIIPPCDADTANDASIVASGNDTSVWASDGSSMDTTSSDDAPASTASDASNSAQEPQFSDGELTDIMKLKVFYIMPPDDADTADVSGSHRRTSSQHSRAAESQHDSRHTVPTHAPVSHRSRARRGLKEYRLSELYEHDRIAAHRELYAADDTDVVNASIVNAPISVPAADSIDCDDLCIPVKFNKRNVFRSLKKLRKRCDDVTAPKITQETTYRTVLAIL